MTGSDNQEFLHPDEEERHISCDFPEPPLSNPDSDEIDGITDWRNEGGR